MKSIQEVSEATGISRFTLSQAARKGRLGASIIKTENGKAYRVDPEHEDFKHWLLEHELQPRVKGSKWQHANKPEGDNNGC